MPNTGKCWEYFSAREDTEVERQSRNMPAWTNEAHRILLDVVMQYARTIDPPAKEDDSSG